MEGSPVSTVDLLQGILTKHGVNKGDLLEIACGTGSNLELLKNKYNVSGLDLSKGMLEVARKKLPDASFYLQDMSNFEIPASFDVIICIYDSVNHLVSFDQWKGMFKCVSRHLREDGIFIFDINTLHKLRTSAMMPPYVTEFEENYLVMKVLEGENNIFDWDVTIFENQGNNIFKRHREMIQETSFEINDVLAVLEEDYMVCDYFGPHHSSITEETKRIFFVCRKK